MRDYELVVLISPQVPDDEVEAVVDRVKQFITTRDGTIGNVNPWGRRKLAYYIQDFEEATYVQIDFSSGPEAIAEVESNLKLTEEVIRHLIVKAEDTAIVRK